MQLALAGIVDPARPTARASIATAAKAGVRVRMITGDYPVTAAAIARSREGLVLVPLAPATPVPGPAVPLPAARLCTDLSARCGIKPQSPPVGPACPR